MKPRDPSMVWGSHYIGWSPIGHRIRYSPGAYWVRFHTLPQSKRYPRTEDEYATVLQRHNLLLASLFRADDEVLLISAGYSSSREPVLRDALLQSLDPEAAYWTTLPLYVEDDAELSSYCHLYASWYSWKPGMFDELLRAIADEKTADIVMVRTDIACAYHPYDGGGDIVTTIPALKDALSREYKDWLPVEAQSGG